MITLLAVVLPAALVIRVADVLIRPWRPCPVCGGSGRHGLSTPRAFGWCWLCHHAGRVARPGARLARRIILRREL